MAHVSICAGLRAILLGIDLIVAHMCVCMCMCVHLYAHNQFSAYYGEHNLAYQEYLGVYG